MAARVVCETVAFFNAMQGTGRMKTPAAFISFRDSLDTANTRRWPVAKYGKVDDAKDPDSKANANRMSKIARDYAAFGAKLEDPDEAADKRSVIQKKGNYLCDVCWRCWPTNYGRYIVQLRPYETSVGWWQQGPRDQAYGRFACGLHHATKRTRIRCIWRKARLELYSFSCLLDREQVSEPRVNGKAV